MLAREVNGAARHAPFAISRSFPTVRQFRPVAATPRSLSAFAASFDRPMPSGACR